MITAITRQLFGLDENKGCQFRMGLPVRLASLEAVSEVGEEFQATTGQCSYSLSKESGLCIGKSKRERDWVRKYTTKEIDGAQGD